MAIVDINDKFDFARYYISMSEKGNWIYHPDEVSFTHSYFIRKIYGPYYDANTGLALSDDSNFHLMNYSLASNDTFWLHWIDVKFYNYCKRNSIPIMKKPYSRLSKYTTLNEISYYIDVDEETKLYITLWNT